MDNNRYVAAWNELKQELEFADTRSLIEMRDTMKELETKYGIPNKEVSNACSQPKKD